MEKSLAGVPGYEMGKISSIVFSKGSVKAKVIMEVRKDPVQAASVDFGKKMSEMVTSISSDAVVDSLTTTGKVISELNFAWD